MFTDRTIPASVSYADLVLLDEIVFHLPDSIAERLRGLISHLDIGRTLTARQYFDRMDSAANAGETLSVRHPDLDAWLDELDRRDRLIPDGLPDDEIAYRIQTSSTMVELANRLVSCPF